MIVFNKTMYCTDSYIDEISPENWQLTRDIITGGLLYFAPKIQRSIMTTLEHWRIAPTTLIPVIGTRISSTSEIIMENAWINFIFFSLFTPTSTFPNIEAVAAKVILTIALTPVTALGRDAIYSLLKKRTKHSFSSFTLPDKDPIFSKFCCTISLNPAYPMVYDPSNGKTLYSRAALLEWEFKKMTSPVTRENIMNLLTLYATDVNALFRHRIHFLHKHGNKGEKQLEIDITKANLEPFQKTEDDCLLVKYIKTVFRKKPQLDTIDEPEEEASQDIKCYIETLRKDLAELDDLDNLQQIPLYLFDHPMIKKYICPITQQPIRFIYKPTHCNLNSEKIYYEREAIKNWIEQNPLVSPPKWPNKILFLPLTINDIIACDDIQQTIIDYALKNSQKDILILIDSITE